MCNYRYELKRHHLTDAPCIYPSFYEEYIDRFPNTKTLPMDDEGFCLFHSTNKNWKLKNCFTEKFGELLSVTIEILKMPTSLKWPFCFSGFHFYQGGRPLRISNLEIPYSLDFRFCQFHDGFTIELTRIKSINIDNSVFNDIFTLSEVTFWDNLLSTHVTFNNGLLVKNCTFEEHTYFDDCTFRNVKKGSSTNCKFKHSIFEYINFENSVFETSALFEGIIFNEEAIFDKCKFSDEMQFHKNEVKAVLSFKEATFLLSSNTNPKYSSVDFRDLLLRKSGKIEFIGQEAFQNMVQGELTVTFEGTPEGVVSFENFNLNKIAPYSKYKLLELEKIGQVQVGRGCRKYYCQTSILEIKAPKAYQTLILDLVKVFCNYFEIHHHYNLGIEIVERRSNMIRYFFFTDEVISHSEFEKRIQDNEIDLWQTFADLSKYEGEILSAEMIEEKNTLIDMATIFLKIRNRISAIGGFHEEQLRTLVNSISPNGKSVIEVHPSYNAIQNSFQSFYRDLPSIKINSIGNEITNKSFLQDFIDGIQRLQRNDSNEICIRNIRQGIYDESAFSYWFINWFESRNYTVDTQTEKGSGRIDLKVYRNAVNSKIIEFKGWWNNDKKNIVFQVCNYLTEFEGEAYIFMINHNIKTDIEEKYKKLIVNPGSGYKLDSWGKIVYEETHFSYYKSLHKLGTKEKSIYHFIYSVY